MDLEEIQKTELQQLIDLFKKQNYAKIEEINKQLKLLNGYIASGKLPTAIVTRQEVTYRHINAGVRSMLYIMISVILATAIFSGICYKKYVDYRRFAEAHTVYEKQMGWNANFFRHMKSKYPNSPTDYIKKNPLPNIQ